MNDRRLLDLYDSLSVAIIVVNRKTGHLSYVNDRVYKDLGMPEGSLKNKKYTDVFWPEFIQVYLDLAERCASGKEVSTVYYWGEKVVWEQISAKVISWDSEKDSILLNITYIADAAQAQAKRELLANFDGLTGLPNGNKLEQDIAELACVEEVSLIYVQLSNIENIHDFHGWNIGDKLLLMIRDWFLETETQRAQYYKGEKGFIILERHTKPEASIERMYEIDKVFSKPWLVASNGIEQVIYCSAKIGAVFGKYVKNEMRNLLLRIMRAEPQGNLPFRIYNEEVDNCVKRQHKLKNSLTRSLINNMEGFSVNFQPIVEAKTAQWVGLEALCRWSASDGEAVAPVEFIPLVEKLGFIKKMDEWVREQAMRHCQELTLHKKQMFLDLNFSPSQTLDDEFAEALLTSVLDTGFPVGHLVLEVTESERMRFDSATLKGLELLKNKGFTFSIDDFGSGYSSIENLIKIAAATIKTDRTIIEDLESDTDRQYLIQALINLAHQLGMKMVAEGVETPAQRQLLEGYGVDYMQGYLFSKPLSAEQLAQETQRFVDA